MAEVEIAYKGGTIASMNASGNKNLLTSGKYCEDNIIVRYSRPSSGSSTPVAEAVITSVTETGGSRSFDITLPKPITKGLVQVVADEATQSSIYNQSTNTYYLLSIFVLFPIEFLTNGTTTILKYGNVMAYRGSSSTFNNRAITNSTSLNITVNDTTMTVKWTTGIAEFFPSGTYKVTVWELADS